MNWLLLLYNIFIATVILSAASATLASWYLFRLDSDLGRRVAFVFAVFAIEDWTTLLTLGQPPSGQRAAMWAVVAVRILAQAVKAVMVIWFTLYLYGLIGKRRKHDH